MHDVTRRLTLALFALPLFACGDDAVKPGSVNAMWAHGGPTATCGTRGVTSVEARLYKGTEEVASGSAPCPADARTGSVGLADIAPGTYRLVVEASNAAGKGLYLGEIARQNISEGKTVDSASVTLNPKPGRLIVDWTVPGQKCSSSPIRQVEVTVYYDAGTSGRSIGTQKVTCDNTFVSPEDGSDRAGVLFDDLQPNGDVIIEAFGYDAAGKKVASATSENFAIDIGDELEPVLALTLCPDNTCP